ncbi:MAG: tail fiber domain-containing protein, partial [Candidatus Thorarchaeota archaeon]
GDISSVGAGNGLTGGGSSGAVTLNVGAGSCITVGANDVGVTSGCVSASYANSAGNAATTDSISLSSATSNQICYGSGGNTITCADGNLLRGSSSSSLAVTRGGNSHGIYGAYDGSNYGYIGASNINGIEGYGWTNGVSGSGQVGVVGTGSLYGMRGYGTGAGSVGVYGEGVTWGVWSQGNTRTADLRFEGELLPDGANCANSQGLRKTGAANWDCVNMPDGSGSTYHIPYWTDSDTLSYDSGQLYWDASSNELGISTSNPAAHLEIQRGWARMQLDAGAGGNPEVEFVTAHATYPTWQIFVSQSTGHMYMDNNNGGNKFRFETGGEAYCYGTNPCWNEPSSRELKTNITELDENALEGILDEILETPVYFYVYKNDTEQELQLGIIAEDSPDWVTGDNKTTIGGSAIANFVLAGVKAQQHLIESQNTDIEQLKEENAALKSLICLDHPEADICRTA